jgi:hypothetical protein
MVSRAELSERFRKVPDGLATVPGQARGLDPSLRAADWTEVESSYKRASDLDRIWGVAYRVGEYLNDRDTVVLDRVIIVYDATQRHERMLLNHLERYIRAHPVSNTEGILDSIVLVNCNIGLPLVFKGYTERTVLDVLSTSRHRRC